MPYYDQWGWYTETVIPGRFTDVPIPDSIPPGYQANWTGRAWVVLFYIPPFVAKAKRIWRWAFRKRFTMSEKVDMELAALDNPSGTENQRRRAATLRMYLQDILAREYVDLEDQDIIDLVNGLENFGIIGVGRASQILTALISAQEEYTGVQRNV